jgi:WD40 repeat protein
LSDGQCLAVLAAHSNIVWALDFSPDGTRLASGSQDHTICLWDMHAIEQGAEGLKPLHTLTAHTRGIGHLVFAPDGCRLASAGADQVAHLWESATGRLLATLTGLPAGYNCLTFSPEGALLASAGGDGVVRLWHIGKILDPRLPSPTATAAAMACLSGPSARVGVLAFSPDGRQLASGSANGDLCLWELSSLAVDARADQQAPPARHLQGHTKTITTIFFRPDGQLISVSEDRTLQRWVVNGADPTVACHGLQGYTSGIWYTAVTADGQFLAGGGGDRTVRIWSLTSGTLVQTLHGHAQGVMALALSPDGTLLATAYQDHQVRLWTMATRTLQSVLHGHTDEIEALAWGVAPTGERLLLASGDVEQKIHLWEPVPGRLCQTLVGDAGWIHALAFHPRQGWLVSASGDAQIRRWQIDYPAGKAAPLTPLVVNGVDGCPPSRAGDCRWWQSRCDLSLAAG